MQLSTDLYQIAREANREHDEVVASLKRGLEHASRSGELLNQAKAAVKHGGWTAWLRANFKASNRCAQLYMHIARELPKLDAETRNAVADLPLREAAKRLAKPQISSGPVTIYHGAKIMKIPELEIIARPPVVIEGQSLEPVKAAPEIVRLEALQREGQAQLDAVHAVLPQRTGPVAYLDALLRYSDTRTPADLAAALEPFSEITAADIEQLVAWLSDAAIALDRRVGQGEARQG